MLLNLQDNRDLGIPALDPSPSLCSVTDSKDIPKWGFPKPPDGFLHGPADSKCVFMGRAGTPCFIGLISLTLHNHFCREVITNVLILQKRKWETQRGPGLRLHLSYTAIQVEVPEGELKTPVCFPPYFLPSWALELRYRHSFLLRSNIRKKAAVSYHSRKAQRKPEGER